MINIYFYPDGKRPEDGTSFSLTTDVTEGLAADIIDNTMVAVTTPEGDCSYNIQDNYDALVRIFIGRVSKIISQTDDAILYLIDENTWFHIDLLS